MATNASNITTEMPASLLPMPFSRAIHILSLIVLPTILLFGTFGNVMIIIIMNRFRNTVSSMSVYFTALAVSDLLFIYTVVMRMFISTIFSYDYFTISTAVCKIGVFLLYVTGVTSPWILVTMTMQRAASVLWPHRVNLLCTRRKSIFTVMGIVLFIACIHSHFLYGSDLVQYWNGTFTFCLPSTAKYKQFINNVWSWVDLLFFSSLPFLFLIISNGLLVKKLAASVREANLTLSAGQCGQAKSREKKVSSVTLTLVIVSITFIILCLPFSLYILLTDFVLDKIPGENVFSRSLKELVYAIINWLWCWNSAVNFYLYCLTGSKFRTECLRVLTFNRFPRRKQNAANNSHLTHFSYANSTNSNTVSYANFDF